MKLVYLTYIEPISGVYEGQVVDVCVHLKAAQSEKVKLAAVMSARDCKAQWDKLGKRATDAISIFEVMAVKLRGCVSGCAISAAANPLRNGLIMRRCPAAQGSTFFLFAEKMRGSCV